MVTREELKKASVRHERAFVREEALRAERDALIAQALRAGWTHAEIAEATGKTRGRIGQIAQRLAAPHKD